MDENAIIAAFAQKLKSLRLSNGLTLEELGEMSGVSISTISKIENRQQKPSFETVLRFARALHINFVQMLDLPGKSPHTPRCTITRAAELPEYTSTDDVYTALAAEAASKTMVPVLMRIKNRAIPVPEQWRAQSGEEFIYVLDGAVEFHTQDDPPATLNKGDSCYLEANLRHAFIAKSQGDASLLSVHISLMLPNGADAASTN
jgi:transcriptional regulator with XRE-family HTH domain